MAELALVTLDPQTFELDLAHTGLSSVHAEALCQQLRQDLFNVVLASHYTDHASTRITVHVTRTGMNVADLFSKAADAVCSTLHALRL